MRRLLSILLCLCLSAAPATAAAPNSPVRATVVMLWTVADPQSASADVRAMDVALRAPFEIGAPTRALHLHAGARFAIALSPSYAAALSLADTNPLGAALLATGERTDARTRDIVALLATMPPLRAQAASTAGARELAALTNSAQRWLAAVGAAHFNTDDLRRAAALNAAARLTNAGSDSASALLAHPPAATAALFKAANDVLRAAVSAADKDSRDAAARGALEFVATPDGAPVLPLLVDSGGKTLSDPSVIPLNAAADASALIDDALAGVSLLARHRGGGLLAPFGAYDDASAQLIAARGARFAVYSDRVLQTSQAGGSVAALRAARASSYQTYGLQIGKTSTLPLYFWADGPSRALDGLATSQPPESFAARVLADASDAGATSFDGTSRVITLRVQLGAPWAQRPDAASLIESLAGALARWGAAATPSGYLQGRRTAIGAYGFAPGSTLGALDAFNALPNQTVMWAALAQARDAAGGDAALTKPAIRTPLLRAESGSWFLLPTLPLAPDQFKEDLDNFRGLLRAVYAGAGQPPPATIAPMRPSTPAPVVPSPVPSATKPGAKKSGYPQGL
ncbi:MAG TPA: hypothetical protein VII69_01010 [Candidatus Eremiobacteraceae bacterium]